MALIGSCAPARHAAAILICSWATVGLANDWSGSATEGAVTFKFSAEIQGNSAIALDVSADRPAAGPAVRPYVRLQTLSGQTLWGGAVDLQTDGSPIRLMVEPVELVPGAELSVHLRYRRLNAAVLTFSVPEGLALPDAVEDTAVEDAGKVRLIGPTARPEGTNVASARYRTTTTGHGTRALIDGVRETSTFWSGRHGTPATVAFLQAYPLDAVTIFLRTARDIGQRLRLEHSLDGDSWSLLADLTDRDYRGRVDVALAGEPARFLRVVGLSSTEGNDLQIDELEAITRAHVPTLERNLAAQAYGGHVRVVSAGSDTPPPPDIAALIDGAADRRGWVANSAADITLELVLGDHERAAAVVDSVLIHTLPADAASGPARLSIAVSTDMEGDTFVDVADVVFAAVEPMRLVSFSPIPARRMQLHLKGTSGADRYRLSEVEVHEAGLAENSVLRGRAFLADHEGPPPFQPNLLDPLEGGSRVGEDGNWGSDDTLIDPASTRPTQLTVPDASLTLRFFRGQAATLDALWLDVTDVRGDVTLTLEAREGGSAHFRPIHEAIRLPPAGRSLFPSGWYRLDLQGLVASEMRLRFDIPDQARVALRRVAATEASGALPLHRRVGRPELELGPNLALAALGGVIKVQGAAATKGVDPAVLIDGLTPDVGGAFRATRAWVAPRPADDPPQITIGLDTDQPVAIAALGIDGTAPAALAQQLDDYRPARRQLPRRVGIAVTHDDPWSEDAAWRALPDIELLGRYGEQRIALPSGVEARGVRFTIKNNFGARDLTLSELAVYATPESGLAVLGGREVDLLTPGLGGKLVSASSQSRYHSAAGVLGGSAEPLTRKWQAETPALPQALTFAFAGLDEVAIGRLTVQPPLQRDAGRRPARIAIDIATGDSPVHGFRRVAQLDWTDPEPLQTAFDPPLKARFVRLVALEATTPDAPVALGPVSVWGAEPASALRPPPLVDGVRADAGDSAADDSLLGTASKASPPERIAPGDRIRTILGGPGQHHRYRLDIIDDDAALLSFLLEPAPRRRLVFSLYDAEGRALVRRETEPGERTPATVRLQPGRYDVEIRQPHPAVVLVIDDSGSMSGSLPAVRDTVRRYLAAKPPEEHASLVRFAAAASVLMPPTADADVLLRGFEGALRADGGTALYDAVAVGLDQVGWQDGDRAIILLSDGADTASHETDAAQLWSRLETSGVRLYAVGLGWDMTAFNPALGMAPQDLLELWGRLTAGLALFAPDASELSAAYDLIAADLRRPVAYGLSLARAEGVGTLLVKMDGVSLTTAGIGSPGSIAFIYDLSGSMAARDRSGVRRSKAALDAFDRALELLPAETSVALVAFGHRVPREPKEASCDDIELLHQLTPFDRNALRNTLARLEPRGQTPIGRSLGRIADLALLEDVADLTVVLITDGEETCDTEPSDPQHPLHSVARLHALGARVTVNVVGFDIEDAAVVDGLVELAAAGDGVFVSAADTEGLDRALRRVLSVPYEILDGAGTLIASGVVDGAPMALPVGDYRLRLNGERVIVRDVFVESGKTQVIVVDPTQ